MIEKILERFKENRDNASLECAAWKRGNAYERADGRRCAFIDAIEIVQEVAKEYDAFDVIYKKVCELEKKYAKGAEDWENVNQCIRLQNLLQYFKEQLKTPYQKGE